MAMCACWASGTYVCDDCMCPRSGRLKELVTTVSCLDMRERGAAILPCAHWAKLVLAWSDAVQ